MITDTIFNALERRGIDRYTLATWRARVLSRHHQAVLETTVIAIVALLVMLFAASVAAR
jgi:hypothetical protein